MKMHYGTAGTKLCGDSHLIIEPVTLDTNIVSCIPCLWAGAAQLHAQQTQMLGALKREVDKLINITERTVQRD